MGSGCLVWVGFGWFGLGWGRCFKAVGREGKMGWGGFVHFICQDVKLGECGAMCWVGVKVGRWWGC